jgi:hypothetical protein
MVGSFLHIAIQEAVVGAELAKLAISIASSEDSSSLSELSIQ